MKIGKWFLGKRRNEQQITDAAEQPVEERVDVDAGIEAAEAQAPVFDREHQKAVIRTSICTGEQVAGFKDLRTRKFTEIMLVRNNEDIEEFTQKYGVSREEIHREW